MMGGESILCYRRNRMADDSNAKRGPERTPRSMPEPIPATPAELARVLVSMPPQKDRKAREQTAQGRELQRAFSGLQQQAKEAVAQ